MRQLDRSFSAGNRVDGHIRTGQRNPSYLNDTVHEIAQGCPDQSATNVEWMRVKQLRAGIDSGEGTQAAPRIPPLPHRYEDNCHFGTFEWGHGSMGMDESDVAAILGG